MPSGSPKTSRHFDDKQTNQGTDTVLQEYAQSFRPRPVPPAFRTSLPDPKTAPASPYQTAPLTKENLRALQNLEDKRPSPPPSTSQVYMRRKGSPKKYDKKKSKEDPDSHPLNLPPDELRRLSAAMAREENTKDPMDLDTQDPITSPNGDYQPVTPSQETPGAFPESASELQTPNGVNGHAEKSPTPPPHKPQLPPVDPEACKAAGNKFFKAKDYERAIAEYTKGRPLFGALLCNTG